MRLGVSTACLGEVSLPEVLKWARECRFQSVEIPSPPLRGVQGWHHQSALNVAGLDGPGRDALLTGLEKAGLRAAALGYDVNTLDGDAGRRETLAAHLARLIETAGALGVPLVCLPLGRDPSLTLGECIAEFARRIAPAAAQAQAAGVRLAIETDPRPGWQFEDMPGNAAFCPELWERLFTHVRSDAVGLAVCPADLLWQGIDPLLAVTDYAEKVFLVRGRDAETMDLRRQDCGVLRPTGGWWRHRLPGMGQVDWRRLIDRLHELRFDGDLIIGGADPVWFGGLDRVKTGLALAHRHLAQFMP